MSRTVLAVATLLFSSNVLAGDATDTYLDATAWISAPDMAEPEIDFTIDVEGIIAGGTSSSVHAWSLYADASWSYDSSHGVTVSSGTLIDADGFGWGDVHADSFDIALDEGTHTLLYVFGDRNGAHGWYDVAAEIEIEVPEQACDVAWLRPPPIQPLAGRTLPQRWAAYDCDTGALWFDADVVMNVYDATGVLVDELVFRGNPHLGIAIGPLYHTNWNTSGLAPGDYELEVVYASGQVLERTITLR